MTGPECERPEPLRPCAAALAEGWINPGDMCPPCTRAFMAALDGIAGPLRWHPAFREQAAE